MKNQRRSQNILYLQGGGGGYWHQENPSFVHGGGEGGGRGELSDLYYIGTLMLRTQANLFANT
jgi:hypothetical protein